MPPSLQPWLSALRRGPIQFPEKALDRIAEQIEPVVQAGKATVAKALLGVAFDSEPEAAFRVEWHPGPVAKIECWLSLHPKAPLVHPLSTVSTYTFRVGEERYYVERNIAKERKVIDAMTLAFPMLTWTDLVSGTDSIE